MLCARGLNSVQEAINWTRERVYLRIFQDEVWAKGGAHTVSFVTVKADGGSSSGSTAGIAPAGPVYS